VLIPTSNESQLRTMCDNKRGESIPSFNADSLQRGICSANFTPRCKPLRRQAGSALPVNLALARKEPEGL
jgi:hypothetical protein